MKHLIPIALLVAACTPEVKYPTVPTEYVCSDMSFIRHNSEINIAGASVVTRVAARDSAGDHFIAFAADRRAIELVVPRDPRLDAEQRTFDTASGSSLADWRPLATHTCSARGGYNDILARYVRGETLDELTLDLSLESKDETRELIHRAIVSLHRRFARDRD